MNPMLNYGIQVIIISGLLYSYYHFVLRNKKFHRYNRFYLLAVALLSLLIPLLNIPVYFTEDQTGSSIVYNTLTVLSGSSQEEGVIVYATRTGKENWFTTTHILQLIYFTIAVVVFMRIVLSLLKINRIIRRHPVEKIENIHFLNTDEPGTPFSFFRWLFWNRKIELNSVKGEQIFRHEMFHIEQKHSLDIIFLELLTVVGWFNPFFHLMKRETRAIHEFLADQFAVTENNRWDYAELLLMQVLNTSQRLVHPFFHNQIKRRIAMITSPQKTSHQYGRKLMVLPLTLLSIFLFAFSYKEIKKEHSIASKIQKYNAADTTIKPTRNVSVINKMIFISDSIIFRSAPAQDPKNNIPEAIAFMNGKRIFKNEYENKAIVCDSIEVYSADDKKAIEIYGPQARSGVMVIYNGKITDVELKDRKEPEPEKIFTKVEIEAAFPGGIDEWRKYLMRNLDGQVPVKNKAPQGNYTVLIQFVVKKDGSISDIRALTNQGFGMEEEAIDVIKNGPKWIPAIQNGKQVNAFRKQPITFVVNNLSNGERKDWKTVNDKDDSLKEVVIVGFEENKNSIIPESNIPVEPAGKNLVFEKVEVEPGFPGGDTKWREYLVRNLNANIPIDSGAPAGKYTVLVQFIVDKEGKLSQIKPLTQHGFGMEMEVMRIIKKGPYWVPAIQNGRNVNAYKKQPVTFVIEEQADETEKPSSTPQKNQPIISTKTLPNIDAFKLLQLPPGTEIISYTFTIDLEKPANSILSVPNSGITINPKTRKALQEARAGQLITIDSIIISENGKAKRIPSRVYYIVD